MEKVRPSVSKSDQEKYRQIEQKYLRELLRLLYLRQ
jgi:hypothetical protein